MGIGKRIKQRRIELGYKQEELADKLNIAKSAISNYETEVSHPKEEILYKLFDVLKCDANYLFQDECKINNDELTESEKKHMNKYRAVDIYAKRAVDSLLDIEIERMSSLKNVEEDFDTIEIPYYEDKAAAGSGYMLNDNGYEMFTVKRSRITERADFIVSVYGASMEPKYYDGDKVLVHSQPDVYEGEIGIFIINGDGFIKQKGSNKLISLNRDYDDIYIMPDDNIICSGKVLGKLNEDDIVYEDNKSEVL